MKQIYARHKRFLSDVDRIMRKEVNLEKVIIYAINYLSLRQIHSDEISNQDLMEVARKISFVDLELRDFYREIIENLTDQEFIFRIKRVKYIRNTKDSIAIVSSPLLKKIGKELMSTTITSKIGLIDDNAESPDIEVPPDTQKDGSDKAKENFDTLEYLNEIWDDPEARLQWLLRNMEYTNRKYGYSQENGYTPEEIATATGRNVLTVKHHLRKYLRDKSSKTS